MRSKSEPGGLVYSTDSGRMCPVCRQPLATCLCAKRAKLPPAGDGVAVTLRRAGGADPERASAALERVIGGLAHDFNNLLTPILAYANLGLGQVRPGEPLYEELSEIRRAAERATALVHSIQSSPAPKCSPTDASGDG